MSIINDDAINYKNMTKEEIEQLVGLEREKAQMISGIHLSHKRALKAVSESPKVQEYVELFGHRPSVEAYKFLTQKEREKKAADAIEQGNPIVSWRDRHKIKTGTLLDDWYG
jgi:hypothetical protein